MRKMFLAGAAAAVVYWLVSGPRVDSVERTEQFIRNSRLPSSRGASGGRRRN